MLLVFRFLLLGIFIAVSFFDQDPFESLTQLLAPQRSAGGQLVIWRVVTVDLVTLTLCFYSLVHNTRVVLSTHGTIFSNQSRLYVLQVVGANDAQLASSRFVFLAPPQLVARHLTGCG